MLLSVILILIGFALLMFGGETLVNGAVAVAKRMNLPTMVIGVVLVGFGTSVPELVTSLEAVMQGAPGIAIGNVVGSNIANVLLVAGAGALLIPVALPASGFWRDSMVLTLATLMFIAAAYDGSISRGLGLMFVAVLVIYVAYLVISEQRKKKTGLAAAAAAAGPEPEFDAVIQVGHPEKSLPRALFFTILGIAITILGAKLLVSGATDIAEMLGVSDTIIGLTVVAIGTSLPELATAIIAGRKGESDVSIGNIMGSNIYNLLAILGIVAIVQPLEVDPSILRFDLWVMTGSTALMMIIPLAMGKINRTTGGVFIAGYLVYLFMLYQMIG